MSRPILAVYRHQDEVTPYVEALQAAGADVVAAPPNEELTLQGYAALLLTGGTDLDPALYGEARHPEADEPDCARDQTELRLLAEAEAAQLPLFAICRGMQLLNVYRGGSLVQHLDTTEHHRVRTSDRGYPAHDIEVTPGSVLASIDPNPVWQVNSRHHQAVRRLGNGLRVTARDAKDQVVEAMEATDQPFWIAVQWHPENMVFSDWRQLQLFQRFADQAK